MLTRTSERIRKEGERLLLLRNKGRLTDDERRDLIISEAKLMDEMVKMSKSPKDKMVRAENVKVK